MNKMRQFFLIESSAYKGYGQSLESEDWAWDTARLYFRPTSGLE